MRIGLERIYGLDALRALTMYLGIVLHAAIPYKSGYHAQYWIDDRSYDSFFFDQLYFWIHSFRMPLFFLLSGFFTVLLHQKIGTQKFLQNRGRRILIPFLFCIVLVLPFSIVPFTFSRLYLDQSVALNEALSASMRQVIDLMTLQEYKGFQHFWFLLNLIYFYLGYIIVSYFFRRFSLNFSLKAKRKWLIVSGIATTTFLILLLYYLNLVPPIWTGFFPQNPQLIYYGFYFMIGTWVFYNNDWLNFCRQYVWTFLLLGTALSVANVELLNSHLEDGVFTNLVVLFKGLLAIQQVFLSFGVIGLCLKYFNSENPRTRYLSDASYWVYIIHFPIVTALQLLCIIFDVEPSARFLLVLSITSILCFVSYQLFVRYSFVGKYLHGPRRKLPKEAIAS